MVKQTLISEKQVAVYLKENQSNLKSYGGATLDIKEFLRGAMILIMDSAKLKHALTNEQGKTSLYNALKHGASMGLSLNPIKKQACLIPYEFDGKIIIEYQIMKDGYIQLALDSGKVEYITSDIVHENDAFKISKSMAGDEYLFSPALKDRGKIIGFFAALKTINNIGHVKYMTVNEVNEIRDKYSAMYNKKKEKSPWTKSYSGMGLKTVLKALFRMLAFSSLKKAIESDDYFDFESPERNVTGTGSEELKDKIKKEADKKSKKVEKKPVPPDLRSKDLF